MAVPATQHTPRQRIVSDNDIEMTFILGDDIKQHQYNSLFYK
ncbi:hypothetical protein [Aquimarina hainanensis]